MSIVYPSLIASRRQIDSEEFGCGYVNNWSTKEYSKYVIEKDKKGKILLARDHGGPWQHPNEIQHNLSLREAMESAKKSYLADIEADFRYYTLIQVLIFMVHLMSTKF